MAVQRLLDCAAPPLNVSVAPVSGSGASHAFSVVFSDSYGYTDIYYTEVLFQTQPAGQSACYVQYVRATNTISPVSDSGTANAGSVQAGIAGTVSNSQCTRSTPRHPPPQVPEVI